MRFRSYTRFCLSLVALAPACASAPTPGTSTLPEVTALEQRAAALETENRRQAEQITLLRGQLALAQAEAREARPREEPRDVVRIGGADAAPSRPAEGEWIEHESPVEVAALPADEPPTPP